MGGLLKASDYELRSLGDDALGCGFPDPFHGSGVLMMVGHFVAKIKLAMPQRDTRPDIQVS